MIRLGDAGGVSDGLDSRVPGVNDDLGERFDDFKPTVKKDISFKVYELEFV